MISSSSMTKMVPCDDSATERELHVSFRSAKETIRDTLIWLGEEGLLSKKHLGGISDQAVKISDQAVE